MTIVRAIPLNKGKVAFVDTSDHDLLSTFRWRALRARHTWYAVTVTDGKGEMYMHDLILEVGGGQQVDHRNGNGLDNRRLNLRPTTHALNQANRRCVTGKSGFKGVSRWVKPSPRPWRAHITVAGRMKFLGAFATPEEAARAYDAAAREYFGEHACTNGDLGLLPPGSGPHSHPR